LARKPNYDFEKRKKEQERKVKKEEKAKRKAEKSTDDVEYGVDEYGNPVEIERAVDASLQDGGVAGERDDEAAPTDA
jgi:hypothetical protein